MHYDRFFDSFAHSPKNTQRAMGKMCPATRKSKVWVKYCTCANFSTSTWFFVCLLLPHSPHRLSDCLVYSLSQSVSLMFFGETSLLHLLKSKWTGKKVQHKVMKQMLTSHHLYELDVCMCEWIILLNINKVLPYTRLKCIILRTSVTPFLSSFDSFFLLTVSLSLSALLHAHIYICAVNLV